MYADVADRRYRMFESKIAMCFDFFLLEFHVVTFLFKNNVAA